MTMIGTPCFRRASTSVIQSVPSPHMNILTTRWGNLTDLAKRNVGSRNEAWPKEGVYGNLDRVLYR